MTRKRKHINKILAPTQSRDNPAKFVYVYVFFLSLIQKKFLEICLRPVFILVTIVSGTSCKKRFPAISCANLRKAADLLTLEKDSSKRKSAEISKKLPAISGLCHVACAFKTRSIFPCMFNTRYFLQGLQKP